MKFSQLVPYLLITTILTISFALNLNRPQVQNNVNPRVFNNTESNNIYFLQDFPEATTHTGSIMPTGVDMPDYLTATTDPTFNTTVTRVSDQTVFGTGSEIFRHENSTRSAWNSDGTKILLGYGSGTAYILDGGDGTTGGTTSTGSSIEYELLDTLEIPNNQEVWSNTDPNLIYSVQNDTELVTIDATTGDTTTLAFFLGYDYVTIGEGKGNPSNEDEYLPLIGHEGTTKTMIIYDLVAEDVLIEEVLGTGDLESITMSQTGEYVIINWDDDGSGAEQGIKAFEIPATGSGSYHLYDYSGEGDAGYDTTNEEVYVQAVDIEGENKVTIINLSNDLNDDEIIDNEIQVRIVPDTGEWAATHVSCRNLDRPGWCYISDSLPDYPNTPIGFNETYALNLDGGTTVQRFVHHHQTDGSGIEAYAMSTVNRDGTRVLFASDWEDADNPDYAYVAEYFEIEEEATEEPTPTPTPTPEEDDDDDDTSGGGGGGGSATPTPTPTSTPSPTPAITGRGFDNIPASLNSCINNYEDRTTKLTDVEDDAFEGYILSLHCRSVISGYSDNTYRSDENITRDALAKYIVNAFDISMDSSGSNFTDVASDNAFFKYILTLKNESIIGGFSDGSFKPSEYVKRQEVTKFIVEAMKVAGEDVDLEEDTDFPDVDSANKFRTYIGFLETLEINSETIIGGYSDGNFKPDDYITRGQMAKMIENSVRYMDETEDEEEEDEEDE